MRFQDKKSPGKTIVIGSLDGVNHAAGYISDYSDIDYIGGVLLNRSDNIGDMSDILGDISNLETIIKTYDVKTALLCIPRVMHQLSKEIQETLNEQRVTVRYIPCVHDVFAGRLGAMHGAIDVANLLDRHSVELDESIINACISGKKVLITGAGGSIGSQLAEMVAKFNPEELMLMERSENGLFEIDRQMASMFPTLPRRRFLHDVSDKVQTVELCNRVKPDIIFHAAAHKHVPMMEDHPAQAVKNNLMGTAAIADAANECGCEKFVMISTDKAVNPTSIMGATKRLAEQYVQALDERSDTQYSIVRFGNVLGSACSVIPIWTDQLSKGGPLTVTDERMTRYFMTIPEAAALVIQAASLNIPNAQIYLLDMGQPIRIVDLANRFVNSYGLEPDIDIEIKITGIRPGEKLHEELLYSGEDLISTSHKDVHLLKPCESLESDVIVQMMNEFNEIIEQNQNNDIGQVIGRYLPEFQSGSTKKIDQNKKFRAA